MVADVHRTLLYGGIFMYPADKQSRDGKLRLLYEVNPLSFVVEQAGGEMLITDLDPLDVCPNNNPNTGKGSNGHENVLYIQPKDIHQRTPVFLGCAEDVADVERFYKEAGSPQTTKL
jgi:fructose-1,6-bisphosphatase I